MYCRLLKFTSRINLIQNKKNVIISIFYDKSCFSSSDAVSSDGETAEINVYNKGGAIDISTGIYWIAPEVKS